MKKRFSVSAMFAACLITALLTAAGSYFLHIGSDTGLSKKLKSIEKVIEEEYIGEADLQKLESSAARSMVAALDDRWSYYMTAEEYEDYKHRLNNTTDGIGVTIRRDEASGGFAIVSVSQASPAEKAGIKAGQIIISVAGQSVLDMEISELKELISGEEGEFSLGVLDENGVENEFLLERETIFSSPVSFEMLENSIGYIRIANFESGAAEGAEQAIEQLSDSGAASLIFDVRANPGGQLREMIQLLDYILPEGEIFISVDKSGKETIYSSDESSIDLEMAVLIDENSYSAAEFFAAALREYDAAVIIGSPSTGKGRSQVTYELYDGSAVHISTARYLTPSRIDLSEQGGIIPDIEIDGTGEYDLQLAEATKYLS